MKFLNKKFKNMFFVIMAFKSMNAAMVQGEFPQMSVGNASFCLPSGNSSVVLDTCALGDFYESMDLGLSESVFGELNSVQSQIKKIAQDQGLGQKTANLVILDQITKNITLKCELKQIGVIVSIPEFVGISNQSIKNLLRIADFDLDKEWGVILDNAGINLTSIQDNLEKQILPEAFIAELKKFAAKLDSKFNEIAEFFEAAQNQGVMAKSYSWIKNCFTGTIYPQFDKEVLDLLYKSQKNNWQLMVRSTGKEDTKQCPNAGGNKSVANVAANQADVVRAIGKVIMSYIFDSEIGQPKSLMQRLKCGDKTIFDIPFTPVLIQRMIGEKFDLSERGDIPVGCVVYTRESEGNTPGVASLQCAFGHPEGVVESRVGIDTCFVDDDKKYHCIIKIKPTRLVPECEQGMCRLVSIPNPVNMTMASALDKDAIRALQIIAAQVQNVYGQPMDLELVYTPKSKTIYLVQARPIQELKFNPEYIKSIDKINAEEIVSGLTICAADASVRFVSNPNEVILASKLDDALNTFNDPKNVNSGLVKVVVVQRGAESTSHAAAVFRGANIPIMIVSDYVKIESWVQQKSKFAVDLQQEKIIKTDSVDVSRGWFTHPLPNSISALDSSVLEFSQSEIVTENIKPENLMPDVTIQSLVELIKESDQHVARQALATILFKINQRIDEIGKKISCSDRDSILSCFEKIPAEQALQFLEKLKLHINKVANDITKVLNLPGRDLRRLYSINWLEALLFQKESKNIVEAYSFDFVIKNYIEMIKFISEKINPLVLSGQISNNIVQDPKSLRLLKNGVDVSFTPEIEREWIKFVNAVWKHSEDAKHQFITMVKELDDFDILSEWINLVFNQSLKNNGYDEVKTLQSVVLEVAQSKQDFKVIQMLKQRLENYDCSQWQYPTKFQSQFKNLQLLIDVFIAPEFREMLNKSTSVRLAAIEIMDQFVDKFDQSIKALKGSIYYGSNQDSSGNSEKVINFKSMLEEYFKLLDSWVRWLPAESLKFHQDNPLNQYLNKIKDILRSLPNDPAQLMPTDWFSVVNAAIGSTTVFERNLPSHAEDVFTLIHQDLLITVGTFTRLLVEKIDWVKPHMFEQAEASLLGIFDTWHKSSAWLVSLKMSGKLLIARYNLPQNHHSLVLDLSFDKSTKELLLAVRFVGQARERWDCIADFAKLKNSLLNVYPVHELDINSNEITITHKISQNDVLELADHLLAMTRIATVDGISFVVGKEVMDLFDRYNKEHSEQVEWKKVDDGVLKFTLSAADKFQGYAYPGLTQYQMKMLTDIASICIKKKDWELQKLALSAFQYLIYGYEPAWDTFKEIIYKGEIRGTRFYPYDPESLFKERSSLFEKVYRWFWYR